MPDGQAELNLAPGGAPPADAPAPADAAPPAALPADAPVPANAAPPADVSSPPTDAPAAAAVEPSAAAAPDPAAEAAAALATAHPTLLESLDGEGKPIAPATPPADAAPAEAAPPADAPPAEAAPVADAPAVDPAAPPAPPAINFGELYELPANITMSDEQRGQFHGALEQIVAGNHKDALGTLIGLHETALNAYAAGEIDRQHEAFANMRAGWRSQIESDPFFSGVDKDKNIALVARARNAIISDHAPGTPGYAKDFEAFNGMDHALGLGDHPIFWHMLRRVARFIGEPSIEETPTMVARNPRAENGNGHPLYDNERSIEAHNRSGRQ